MNIAKKILALGLLASFAFLFPTSHTEAAGQPEQRDCVTVRGLAERQVAPDTAYVTVGVVSQSSQVETARAENARTIDKMVKALSSYGISGQAIKTSSFNLYPNYADQGDTRRVNGYTIENALTVEVKDLNKIGDIIDSLFAAGANRLDGVRFAASNYAALQDELLKEAVADGLRKANIVAKSAGRNVGLLINATVNSGGGLYQPEYRMAIAKGAMNDSSQVFGGVIKLTADIQLVYELK